jgi:hypothetical protein
MFFCQRNNREKDNILGELFHVKDVGFNYWSIGRGKKRGGSIGSRVLYDGERRHPQDVPYLKGRDMTRYGYVFGNHWLRHDYKQSLVEDVDIFRFTPEFLEVSPKIIYRQTSDRIIATIDTNKYYLDKTVHLIVPKANVTLDMNMLLGILNSKLMLYYYRDMVREEGRTFAQVCTVYIKPIPLKIDTEIGGKISELVKRQLELTSRLNSIGDKKVDEKTRLEEDIKKGDSEVDQLVYELYGIKEDERSIIEENSA